MRWLVPLAMMAMLPLGGCVPGSTLAVAAIAGGGGLVATGKTPVDYVAGWLTTQDCSAVRLEQRRPWCVPIPAAAPPPPYCTRSIGSIDCWTSPPPGAPRRGVADPGPFPEPEPGPPPRPWGAPM
jgi:hypothetical protein